MPHGHQALNAGIKMGCWNLTLKPSDYVLMRVRNKLNVKSHQPNINAIDWGNYKA